jgi:three-Cys-motif partner protein
MGRDDLYEGREQSKVKHEFLHKYLDRFAHIIGSWSESITYVDGFSGPWNSRDAQLKDSSFAIALRHLRQAAANLTGKGKLQRIRCVFVEKDARAFAQLKGFAEANQGHNVEILALHSSFEDVIDDVVKFIRRDRRTFSFTFIDPKGWTGFAIRRIEPLLKLRPGEVLVNLMTSFITRQVETANIRHQFEELYGSSDVIDRVKGLTGLDRIDACVNEYCRAISRVGGFPFVCPAFVLKPEENRPHFNLVYATRDERGVEVFREAERRAMNLMEAERAKVEARTKKQRTGQGNLFAAEDAPASEYYRRLRNRYLAQSLAVVKGILNADKRVPYDRIWQKALAFPLVWESDLKSWIQIWRKENKVTLDGLGKGRVAKRGANHILVWMG